jgi:hypothetical protein
MNTLSLKIGYRPLKIGWCVRNGNKDDLRKVILLTHTMWGGRFNPIIPVGEDLALAKSLINVFRVDALYAACNDKALNDFIESFSYLPWPMFEKELFMKYSAGNMANILDIRHPVLLINEKNVKSRRNIILFGQLTWNEDDPLGDIFKATYGDYPNKNEIGIDYYSIIKRHLKCRTDHIEPNQPVPLSTLAIFSPSRLTVYNIVYDRLHSWDQAGLYVGDSQNFVDLINFWNLRASNIDLIFYDPHHANRLEPLKDAYIELLSKRPQSLKNREKRIAIWSKSNEIKIEKLIFGGHIIKCVADATIWNGFKVIPPVMHFGRQSILATLTDDDNKVSVSFQLPEKPFFIDRRSLNQHLIVSITPFVDIMKYQNKTLQIPFIPELNEFLGRECHFMWNAARAEIDGLGIVINVTQDQLTLNALEIRRLVIKLFEAFGIIAEPSHAGLVNSRLIEQMGGPQGCRVFKIKGVRELIKKYGPLKSFTRSCANQIIGQLYPESGKPNFSKYENLYIERRESGKLKPEDAFLYLVKKGVFRVGLTFECPSCQLKDWHHIDEVKTSVVCEFCGNRFNITTQLRDRDWKYRRSGLFGSEDNQEGGIPVALTIQQLDTLLEMRSMIFTAGMRLKPICSPKNECETDLVVLTQGNDGRTQIGIGECKTRGEINEQDVINLKTIAELFPHARFDVFIFFSKLSKFTPQEIERCRTAQGQYRLRVILLTERELEPYLIYEETSKDFEINKIATSLEDLAESTNYIFFEPRPRKSA